MISSATGTPASPGGSGILPALLGIATGIEVPATSQALHAAYIADNLEGLSDGDGVSLWEDESGNDRHFNSSAHADAADPLFYSNQINGKACLRFVPDGGSGHGMDGVAGFSTGLTAAHVYIVLHVEADPQPGGKSAEPLFWGGDTSEGFTHYCYTNGDIYSMLVSGERGQTDPAGVTLSDWHVFEKWADPTDCKAEWNGADQYDDRDVFDVSHQAIPLLGHADVANHHFAGEIAAILIYPAVLDSADQAVVESWLNEHFGIAFP